MSREKSTTNWNSKRKYLEISINANPISLVLRANHNKKKA